MLTRSFLALAATALMLAVCAWTPAASAPQPAPRFTMAEQVIIARNDALTALMPVDPWGVRKIVDALNAVQARPAPGEPAPRRDPQRDVGSVEIDPQRNPDLAFFQRASPEAAYDLFQLLKRVAGGQSGVKRGGGGQ